MTVAGIDVAWPQGDYDWSQHAGLAFGMCKATEGLTLADPAFEHNWDAMWDLQPDHRVPRFGYHFFHAADDPDGQAEHLVTTVKAHGLLAGDNLAADFEATDPRSGLNDDVAPDVCAARARTFLQTVNRLAPGHRILAYTNPAFARTGACAGLGDWYLWLADYGVTSPVVPEPWDRWTFWQYASSPVDQDVYNGTAEQLLAFTRMPDKR